MHQISEIQRSRGRSSFARPAMSRLYDEQCLAAYGGTRPGWLQRSPCGDLTCFVPNVARLPAWIASQVFASPTWYDKDEYGISGQPTSTALSPTGSPHPSSSPAGLRLVGSKVGRAGRGPGLCMFLLEPVSGEQPRVSQLRGKESRSRFVSWHPSQVRCGRVSLHFRVLPSP